MEYLVPPEEDGRRLRDVLRRGLKLSTGELKNAKWNGKILVNGIPRTVDQFVSTGERITILLPQEVPAYRPEPYALPLDIIYQDEHLMVINKPAPLPSTSGSGQSSRTLENALFSYFSEPEDFIYRPVNRLDKGTSGLMVVALNAHSQQLLQRLLHTDNFIREYAAIVESVPTPLEGTINLPIGKEDSASIRRVIREDGSPSVTHYRTVFTDDHRSLVRLRLETGRTHQIRVHMKAIGCPVCGDFLYGTELNELPGRFALHSEVLRLIHPLTGEPLHFEAALPEAFRQLLPSSAFSTDAR